MGYRVFASIQFKIVVVYCRWWCRLVDRLGDVCGWGEYAENSVGVDASRSLNIYMHTFVKNYKLAKLPPSVVKILIRTARDH